MLQTDFEALVVKILFLHSSVYLVVQRENLSDQQLSLILQSYEI